ncbi:MAG: hypothetical protein M1819_005212 [Sarea resinae]|nr:MAG: hypothetical protein M1819_005212 [Sarea resinae]
MAKYPEEELLMTLYADVHYYFSNPTSRPVHHRFDRESYVYLHRHTSQGTGRLEIANNVGTSEQDAFFGFLDTVHLEYSYKHPTLVTLTIDGRDSGHEHASTPPPPESEHAWFLPAPDRHGQGRYMFKIRVIDIYFWTAESATEFVEAAKEILTPEQIRLLHAPAAPSHSQHQHNMSPVVRKLEEAAVSDRYPPEGARGDNGSAAVPSFAPPPQSIAATSDERPASERSPVNYTPIAYNPAAPAAPEPIQYREKTPPPVDAEAGTGLAAAALGEQLQQTQQPPFQPQTQFAPPPTFGPPQPQQSQQYYSTVPQQASQPYQVPQQSTQPCGGQFAQTPLTPSFAPPPQSPAPAYGAPYITPSFAAPPQTASAGAHSYGHGSSGSQSSLPYASPYSQPPPQQQQNYFPPQASQHHQRASATSLASASPASSFTSPGLAHRASTQSPQQIQNQAAGAAADPYDVHSQMYVPTDDELRGHHKSKRSAAPGAGPGQAPGKLEQKADKVEKGVNRFLKMLEKRVG